jgi:hypothetical protein
VVRREASYYEPLTPSESANFHSASAMILVHPPLTWVCRSESAVHAQTDCRKPDSVLDPQPTTALVVYSSVAQQVDPLSRLRAL